MNFLAVIALLGLASAASHCPAPYTPQDNDNVFVKRPPSSLNQGLRSVYIAGLFGLHGNSDGINCNEEIQTTSVQNLMAFLYAIDNAKTKVPQVNTDFGLGGIVFDTCKSTGRAIQHVTNFEMCTLGYGQPNISPALTFGYVGPETIWAKDVAPIIASFQKTQVAFSSTHPMFADKEEFPFLFRTIPDDKAHIAAIVKFLTTMKYQSVQFVYVDSGMGQNARDLFEDAAEDEDICIEQSVSVPSNVYDTDKYNNAVNRIVENPTVMAVVMWFDRNPMDGVKSQTQAFMEAVKRLNAQGMFFWVGTDSWFPFDNDDLKQTTQGAVIISPTRDEAFEAYFRNLKPNDDHPEVFREWWMNKFDCDLPGSDRRSKDCNLVTDSLLNEYISPRAGYIIQAVQAIADGLRIASEQRCFGQTAICDSFLNSQGALNLVNDKVMESLGGNVFNANTGDIRQKNYEIWNLRRPSGNTQTYHYQKIGSTSQLDDNDVQIQMDTNQVYVYDIRGLLIDDPVSYCPYGSCDTCAPPTQPPIVDTTQPPVETTEAPKEEKTGPYLHVRKMTWVIPLMVLSGLGLLITICFEIYILSKLLGSKTVKQFRTMWLGQLLLIGIFLSYLLLFAFVPSPTYFTCGLIRFGVGSCYAIMYSVLLVKLMIILSSESIGYLKGVYQVLMFIFAFAVQVVIDVEWLILIPPTSVWNESLMAWQCTDDYLSHIQSLVYVMFLIFICTVVAAHSHGIITNHREGIFIGLAAGFSIPIWIAWALVGSLNEDPAFQEPSVAYGLLINTTLILFTMFLPKVRQLNTMGVEGVYLEDDGNDNEAYGSVIYGPPSYAGSAYQVNGAPMLTKDSNGHPVQLLPSQQILYDQISHPSYVRANSVRSVPAYARSGNRTLRVTGDLTGRHPFDKKAASEIGYRTKADYRAGVKRAGSVTDLGAL